MASYNFRKDLSLGQDGEADIVEHLEAMGLEYISSNNDNKYDVIMSNKLNEEVKYEIKTDVYCTPRYDTGNIFVEYECRGKASGIRVTEAKWFVTYFKNLDEIWYIETEKMIEIIENAENRANGSVKAKSMAGDRGSNTKGFLVKRDEFFENFKIFNKVDGKWIKEVYA